MNDWAPARDEPLRDRRRYRARYRDAGRTVPIRSQHVEHKKVDLEAKLAQFDEQWSPKLVGELNGQEIKLAKMEDEFVWHHHAADELFLVLDGHLTIELREGSVDLGEGEFFPSSRAASSTSPSRTARRTSCCSNPPKPGTPATSQTSAPATSSRPDRHPPRACHTLP